MADFDHTRGQDLQISAVGGLLLLASGSKLVRQRVIRRLTTCFGDYKWFPDNWGNLPAFIGEPARDRRVRAVTLKAMRHEAGVDQSKPISVDVHTEPSTSITFVKIQYTDKQTAEVSQVTVPLVPTT